MSTTPPPPPADGTPPSEPRPGQYGATPYGSPEYGAPTTPGSNPGSLMDRFLARLIDGVVVGIVTFLISTLLGAVLIAQNGVDSNGNVALSDGSRVLFNVVSAVVSTLLWLAYFALLESSRGQTLGKMALKLTVVGPEGGKPTLSQALKRNVWLAFGILGVLGFAGSLLGLLLRLGAVILIAVGISQDATRRQHYFDKFAGGTEVRKLG